MRFLSLQFPCQIDMENDFLRYINVETYHASQKKRKLPKKTKDFNRGCLFWGFCGGSKTSTKVQRKRHPLSKSLYLRLIILLNIPIDEISLTD